MWRPENWEKIKDEKFGLVGGDFEAGADAMHQADVKYLKGLFNLLIKRGIFHIDEIRESEEWLTFISSE